MNEFLVFRLFGPLAAWGEIAVGEVRGTAIRPTRSALLGLLAAALGIERHEDEQHQKLSESVGFAVRVDAPGLPLVDYHTVNFRHARRKEFIITRADELGVPRSRLTTAQSWRHYRVDSLVTVAVALRPGAAWSLEQLRGALERPRFPLCLGRKSCVPGLPLSPAIVSAEELTGIFGAFDTQCPSPLPAWYPHRLTQQRQLETLQIATDSDFPLKLEGPEFFERRDEVLSRRRWRFQNRLERVYSISRRPPADEEVRDVSQPSLPG